MLRKKQKRIIDVLIVIVIVTQLVQWLQDYWYSALSLLGSLTYILCYRMARKSVVVNWRYYFWMWVPTCLFVIMPTCYSLFTETTGTLTSLFLALPLFSLLLPVALLFWLRATLKANDGDVPSGNVVQHNPRQSYQDEIY